GEPTTSRDVAFTIDRVRDPATGSPRASELAQLTRWTSSGPHEITLHFATPQPDLPGWVAELPIAPSHLLRDVPPGDQRSAAFGAAPTGNGPYRFVSRDRGERWIFERNDDFPASM